MACHLASRGADPRLPADACHPHNIHPSSVFCRSFFFPHDVTIVLAIAICLSFEPGFFIFVFFLFTRLRGPFWDKKKEKKHSFSLRPPFSKIKKHWHENCNSNNVASHESFPSCLSVTCNIFPPFLPPPFFFLNYWILISVTFVPPGGNGKP